MSSTPDMTPLVGSLIFVGLQMRQTQEIALSQAYQSRAETSINTMLAHLENDAALSGMTKMYEGHSDELTPNESAAPQTDQPLEASH